jgi:hypothetical protein
MKTRDEVIHAFTPVGNLDQPKKMRLQKLETSFKELATDILDLVPPSGARDLVLIDLLKVKMGATQAVTHYIEKPAAQPPKQENKDEKSQPHSKGN